MQIHGRLEEIFDTVDVSEKFKKREFVVTTDEQTPYPQSCIFQITQDKCSALDAYAVGDEVSVDFNVRGRKWEGTQGTKFFNTLEAWRLQLVNKGTGAPVQNANNNNNNTATKTQFSELSLEEKQAIEKMRMEKMRMEKDTANKNNTNNGPVFTGNVGDNDDLPF